MAAESASRRPDQRLCERRRSCCCRGGSRRQRLPRYRCPLVREVDGHGRSHDMSRGQPSVRGTPRQTRGHIRQPPSPRCSGRQGGVPRLLARRGSRHPTTWHQAARYRRGRPRLLQQRPASASLAGRSWRAPSGMRSRLISPRSCRPNGMAVRPTPTPRLDGLSIHARKAPAGPHVPSVALRRRSSSGRQTATTGMPPTSAGGVACS
jgi:hypothetical protein